MKIKLFILLPILVLLGTGCESAELARRSSQAETGVKDANLSIETNMPKQNTRTLSQHKDLAAEYNQALIKTNKGNFKVEFYSEDSPITVNNFLNLAKQGFYNGTSFHRIIKDFMIQGGDPNSRDNNNRSLHGTGDPGYKFSDEFNSQKLIRGSLAMANSGPNTNGSQFFIVTAEATPWLDGKHTNFGIVKDGMDVIDKIENVSVDQKDNPYEPVIVESIELIK